MTEHKIQECFALTELQQLLKQSRHQITIIDVRGREEYVEKHIPGAINIPLSELESCSKGLSNQAIIITACGKGGGRSAAAAEKLKQLGFTKANYLCGGTFGWYDAIKQ